MSFNVTKVGKAANLDRAAMTVELGIHDWWLLTITLTCGVQHHLYLNDEPKLKGYIGAWTAEIARGRFSTPLEFAGLRKQPLIVEASVIALAGNIAAMDLVVAPQFVYAASPASLEAVAMGTEEVRS